MKVGSDVTELARILQHISMVQALLRQVAHRLLERADVHDLSKLAEDEFGGLGEVKRMADQYGFGSPEYVVALSNPSIVLHWGRNPHHPEHHSQGFRGMSALDVIEMVCDWKATNVLRGHPEWDKSVDLMAERLHLSVQEFYFVKAIAQLVKDVGG